MGAVPTRKADAAKLIQHEFRKKMTIKPEQAYDVF